MRKTKIFYGNQHIDSMYCGKSKWQVVKFKAGVYAKRTIKVFGIVSIIGWSLYIGSTHFPQTEMTYAEVVKVVESTSTPPVLQRIAVCESGGNQMKNGQVQIHMNDNRTVDIGKYMINLTVWGKTATKMGLDLTKEGDNEKFAKWLYENKGTEDWYASKACWSK